MSLHHIKQVGRNRLQTLLGESPHYQPVTLQHVGPLVAQEIINQRASLTLLHPYSPEEPYLAWLDTSLKKITCWDMVVDTNSGHLEGIFRSLAVTAPYQSSHPKTTMSYAVLNWSVYDGSEYLDPESKTREWDTDKRTPLKTFSDFLLEVGFRWSKNDYRAYWLELGAIVKDQSASLVSMPDPMRQKRHVTLASMKSSAAVDVGESGIFPIPKPRRWSQEEHEAARALLMLSCY